ncbi:alpha/beta hydrolase family protein [Alicyclobacillus herbarius]|uniref:alpha/beta hydrolase family protein n=1 Tax=Alicyclobacillus herbarius TaxID=122960 RepID=UPI0024806DCC|nr:alpha/beta fold hydrolase [Alicyclobacillus herbarius]
MQRLALSVITRSGTKFLWELYKIQCIGRCDMPHFNTKAYVENAYESAKREYDLRHALDAGDLQTWQASFRSRLASLLGVAEMRDRYRGVPLSARKVGEWVYDSYRCEKLYLTSEPEVELPFYVFLPNKLDAPFPLYIALHGHNTTGKEVFLAEDAVEHDLLLAALREGYAVIVPDVRAFGEMSRAEDRKAGHPNSCEELQRRSLMMGCTLIGERVYDVMRLIDYAHTRSEIDSHRIIVNGHSGGGAVTLFAAALDTRITAAIPTSYLCTFKESILSIRHCVCNLIPGILQLGEMQDVAALCAPRPILFIHGKEDPIFPVSATKQAFAEIRGLYRQLGAEACCELYVGEFGHIIHHDPIWPFLRKIVSL